MNKIITTLSVVGIATLGFAGMATAQDSVGVEALDIPNELLFATVDADVSGDVTFEEILEVDPEFSQDLYAQADTDGSGALTETEYNVLLEADVLAAPKMG